MTDYSKLVKALRCCTQNPPETCVGCTYNIGNNECAVRWMMCDAASAIEELQAIAHSHCVAASSYWEELEELKAQLPKRGEWKVDMSHFSPHIVCSVCGVEIPCVAGWCMDAHMNYCPNCGAKMTGEQDVE